ncbi:MAG: tetratricopeptide repeat protein [Anaerolineales bacterium]|nr:tetratricopeptide repeat protein [Anaerolineales bacterium]
MPPSTLILQSKITPPLLPARTLARERIAGQLLDALNHRLTILQAGAGYGKSTALATLAARHRPFVWYQVSRDDNDLVVFLLHLCHATRLALPDIAGLPIPELEAWDATRDPFPQRAVVYQYLNALSGQDTPTLLVIDDAHLIIENAEIAHVLDQLIALAPPHFHILLSSRLFITLPNLSRWRMRGEVLTLDQSVLAFTQDEIAALFEHHYHYELTEEEAGILYKATEGWAITLQLIWQSLRSGSLTSISEELARQDKPLESLFEMLAQDVLALQPEDVQRFLRATSVLRELTPDACNALLKTSTSAAMLAYLRRQEFFVVDVENPGDETHTLRYHFIFHRFLRQQSTEPERREWHTLAGDYFLSQDDFAAALYHFLRAENPTASARLLVTYGSQLLSTGRLDTLASYLDALPPATLSQYPTLLFYLGDLARLRSRFQEALGWYQQAESLWRENGQPDGVSRALRGQARVYLDTVNPSRAEELLQQSLRLSDGTVDREAQARLLELLAENKLNAGKPLEAERLRQQARALLLEGPSDNQLLYRVLLRTGRLTEAIEKLEIQAEVERESPVQTPRAHRETPLLLSILYAFLGMSEPAYRTALEGTQRGLSLSSPFITAVGYMRQGHGLMLLGDDRYDEARAAFEKTIELSNQLAVPRLCVEAYWGLCRAYGYKGDLANAEDAAQKGIEIAAQAGDEWMVSITSLAMGNSFLFEARYETAETWLNRARRGFEECSDPFGVVVSQLMLCLGWLRQGDTVRVAQVFPGVLKSCQQHGYEFLFTRPTILAVSDARMLTPLLVFARNKGWELRYVEKLLRQLGLPDITMHPGYQVRMLTLGTFQTWLGGAQIPNNAWLRASARQLWQLLLTFHEAPLDREQIFEHLWPGTDPEAAQRNFKVALNTLYKVLEPNRPPGADSAFILREGTVYALRPGADLWLDAREFTQQVREAEAQLPDYPNRAIPILEQALSLYPGEYIPEARYETWAAAKREQLAVVFLQAADRLCELYLRIGRFEETISLAHRILGEDPCWERAYQHLMQAYVRVGDHGQAARTYHRCVETLEKELEVPPSAETEQLYKTLTERT